MSVPKSVIRFDKNGVKYVSNVDKCAYTINELTRAALRDVGKMLCRYCNSKAMALRGLSHNRRVRGSGSAFQYWARKKECDLQFGCTDDTWYGVQQELGTSRQPKRQFMRNTAYDNIATIVQIESQYLSGLEDEAKALSLIDEEEYRGSEE